MDSETCTHSAQSSAELLTRSSLISGLKALSSERWTNFVLVYAPLLKFWIQRKGVFGSAVDDVLQESLQSICAGIGNFQRDAAKGSFVVGYERSSSDESPTTFAECRWKFRRRPNRWPMYRRQLRRILARSIMNSGFLKKCGPEPWSLYASLLLRRPGRCFG